MDNNMGGDLAAGTRAVDENVKEKGRSEAETKDLEDMVTEEEKQHLAGSSVDSASDSGPDDLKKYDSKIVKIRDVPEGDAALAHLPEHERDVLKRQLDMPTVSVSWLKLYRYATTWDLVIVGISAFCAIGAGAVMPLMTVSLSSWSNRILSR
jgi:ATP-binding cassette subfamily B (MDR/TAP) protein 1